MCLSFMIGHGFPLTGLTCDIGRGESADIRVLSADVSNIHCKLSIDEASGEASLEVLGNEIEVNQITCHSSTILKLNHKDVILVGGRKLRFEYLPPDFKPLPSNTANINITYSTYYMFSFFKTRYTTH